jgi:AbrB family looped-hinge helix DNA binding protein
MHVTSKGQITIPLSLRQKFNITVNSELDFFDEGDKIVIKKKAGQNKLRNRFEKYRGIANLKMTTKEIMKLTRGS